jgi:cell division protein ZapB
MLPLRLGKPKADSNSNAATESSLNDTDPNFHAELAALSKKLDALIALCERLGTENDSLKARAEIWTQERDQLLERTDTAKNRLETMISRLKLLGHEP